MLKGYISNSVEKIRMLVMLFLRCETGLQKKSHEKLIRFKSVHHFWYCIALLTSRHIKYVINAYEIDDKLFIILDNRLFLLLFYYFCLF